jgi:hypothetical protein
LTVAGIWNRIVSGSRGRSRPTRDAVGQRRTFDQLHDEIVGADVVQRADVRVVERRDRPRLALEAVAEMLGGHLDRHVASETRVARAVHLTHSAGANRADDLVRTESGAWRHQTVHHEVTKSGKATKTGLYNEFFAIFVRLSLRERPSLLWIC